MQYHITTKNEVGNVFYMLVSNEPHVEICWLIDKTIATEFEYDDAKRLIGALECVADVKNLIIEPAEEAWILVSQQTMYLDMYVSTSSAVTGIKWARVKDNAKEFESQEEAEKYSQALKTLFDISTTPKKLS